MITIRAETSKDIPAIRHVLEMAFGQASEARLVEALRQADALITSLVAVEKEQIVGHIAFSAVFIESLHATTKVVALVPLEASLHGICCPFDVPDDAFMAAELFPGALAGQSGSVKYRPEFDLVSG
jgi:predicted N-acetyltransferase YhbS